LKLLLVNSSSSMFIGTVADKIAGDFARILPRDRAAHAVAIQFDHSLTSVPVWTASISSDTT
jgi:hypothetical protein